ncbi:MAG: CBS domain-containing protein, partial [Clostridiaceae bacterium]|nr:CBS domain-containing protein [Clostridiaceae bacterium]
KKLLKNLVISAKCHSFNGIKILIAKAEVEDFVIGLAHLTHTLSEIEHPDALFSVVKMEDRVHIVGRSNVAQVEINKIVAHFDGGGHAEAASATVKNGSVDEVVEKLLFIINKEIRAPLLAGDIMSSPVKSVISKTTIAEANHIMLRYGHTGLPVVNEGKVVGVISRRDVEKAMRHGLGHAPVKGFMSGNVKAVQKDTPVSEVQRLMIENNIGRLPIIDGDRLVGIVSRTDLLRTLHGEVQARHKIVYNTAGKTKYYNNISDLMRRSLTPSVWSLLKQVGKISDGLKFNVYAAGGIVRDIMLGADSLDIDLVVEGDGILLADTLAAAFNARVRKFEKFGTAEIEFEDGLKVDIATARVEFYEYPAALPEVESSSLRQDLYRRDFTINAMAVALNENNFGNLVDFFGGREDLQYGLTGMIRVLHNLSFIEDPTRIIRAVRFEQRYKMDIEPQTLKLLREAVNQKVLDKVSNARLWDEIKHVLKEPRAAIMLERLAELDIWPYLFPGVNYWETEPVQKRLASSMSVLKSWGFPEPTEKWLPYIIAILHWSNEEECLEICQKYNLSKRQSEKIIKTVSNWQEIISLMGKLPMDNSSTINLARIMIELSRAAYPVLLSILEEQRLRDRFRQLLNLIHASKPAISGKFIKSLGYRPGPIYREVLEALWEARIEGKVLNEEQEKDFVRKYLQQHKGKN